VGARILGVVLNRQPRKQAHSDYKYASAVTPEARTEPQHGAVSPPTVTPARDAPAPAGPAR
jgi:hypothetical protein